MRRESLPEIGLGNLELRKKFILVNVCAGERRPSVDPITIESRNQVDVNVIHGLLRGGSACVQ